MSLPDKNAITLESFYKMRENTTQLLEYIDGAVYMSPSPSTVHQRISGRLHAQLFNLLEKSPCEIFHAPFDVELQKEGKEGTKIVIPDLAVICDKKGLDEQKYAGVPTVIIEIVNPSNQAHDLVTKLDIYMKYGVKEYWIINPMLNTVQLYSLNQDGEYFQKDIAKQTGIVQSEVVSGFTVDTERLFSKPD